ncbi:MAG: Hsp20/alpha crystallin family protein [Candidatus Magnetominusculus sp. LBB02]|nr:Hsp20/alpha crystallin family protein [Candidatus Magnetominusculus sp. LBB02]
MSILRWYPTTAGYEKLFGTTYDVLFDRLHHDLDVCNTDTAELTPRIEVLEKKDSYVLRVELPGVKKEDVDISVNLGVLKISGEKKADVEEGAECGCSERAYGKFLRTFQLSTDVDADAIAAVHEDGILELCLPKRKEALIEEKKIKVA